MGRGSNGVRGSNGEGQQRGGSNGVRSQKAIRHSVMALRDMKLHPERHGMGRVWTGFILGSIGTLILCFYGLTVMRRLLR